jgi:hypothetical protein
MALRVRILPAVQCEHLTGHTASLRIAGDCALVIVISDELGHLVTRWFVVTIHNRRPPVGVGN